MTLPEGCHVHHRNGNQLDNRLENLEVLDASEHARRHHAERRSAGTSKTGHLDYPYGL